MPQIALILCRSPVHFLESTLTDKSLLWANSMLIQATDFYSEFIALLTVRSEVMYFFIIFYIFFILKK